MRRRRAAHSGGRVTGASLVAKAPVSEIRGRFPGGSGAVGRYFSFGALFLPCFSYKSIQLPITSQSLRILRLLLLLRAL